MTMTRPKARAYVMKDGEVLSDSYLERYAVAKAGPHSQQLAPDSFSSHYSEQGLVEPIYNPAMLAQLMDLSTYHARAVKTKAHDIAGLGWSLEPVEGVEEPSDDQRERAATLLDRVHPEMSLTELLDQFMIDFEATGNAYLEVLRDEAGQISGLEHVPAHTIRVHQDGRRFQQRRGTKHVWFSRYGTDQIDRRTGGEVTDQGQAANELINLKSYTPQSDFYGVPDIVPALGAILGDVKRQEYNISFFDNHAVPAYAVTVTGADLDEETKDQIKRFFMKDVKENPHSTLVLSAEHSSDDIDAPPVEFQFEALSTDTKEASFSIYRGQNRDEILSAHGVPPYRAGIITEGQMGGSSAAETTEIYKQSIVNPRKQRVESRLTRVLLQDGLDVTDWRIVLGELDTRDMDREIERMKILFDIGYYTPNEMRGRYGEEPSTDEGMDSHYIGGRRVDEMTNDDRFASFMESTKQLHTLLAASKQRGAQ